MSKVTAIISALVICIIVCLSWAVNHYRDNAIAYKEQRDKKVSELKQATATITDMQQRQRDADALDAKYTKELADAKAENDALRRKLDNGGRVLVKGKCPVPSSAETSSASGMGNDATVELSPVAGRNVLSIRSGNPAFVAQAQQAFSGLNEQQRNDNAVAKNLGASDAAKYLKANSDYANVYNKVLNKNIANKLNKASSEASPELINTVVLSRKPSDVKRIWSALDDKGKDAMRAAYVSKIAEKAGDSPAKFITEVNKLKSQSGGEIYNTIFSGKHMKELDALHEVLQQTARSDTANVVTQTGQSQANRIRTIGATATLGVSMGLEAGFGAMMRLYESKAARNALLRLANTKAGTPAYERALNQAATAVRPLLANEATRQ